MKMARRLSVGATVLLGWAATGCISQHAHDLLKSELASANEDRLQLQSDLERARAKRAQCEAELAARESGATSFESMVRILKEQNAGLSGKNDDLARLLQECLERGARPPVIIQKTALPPALDQALKDFAAQYPGQVTYDPARGMVKFGSDLLFDLGKTTIRQNATEALGAFAEIVASQAAANFDVIVVGHTDNVPIVRKETKQRHPTNWHLSVHRAISVMSALSKSGVGSSRMGVLGYGEHRPIVSNPTRGGNQANRRVELYLVGKNTVCLSEVIPPLSAAGASESVRVVTSVEGE